MWNLRSEDSTIGTLSDKIFELVRRSRFAGSTGPLIGCILLSLDLAFQENLVRSDPLSVRSSYIEVTSASGPRHFGDYAPWLRMVKTLVDDWENSRAAHFLEGRFVPGAIWRSPPSWEPWASFPKEFTDLSVTR